MKQINFNSFVSCFMLHDSWRFMISTVTVKGHGLGKTIGYPTINMKIPDCFSVKHGVYACTIFLKGKKYKALLYYGPKTIGDNMLTTLEAHILKSPELSQFPISKIKEKTKIAFILDKFLRKPKKLDSIQKAREQIEKDIHKYTKTVGEKV